MRSWKDVNRHEALIMVDSVGERLHLVLIFVAFCTGVVVALYKLNFYPVQFVLDAVDTLQAR